MNRSTQVIATLSGMALTAGAAYLFDRDNGKRRRAELGEGCKSAAKRVNERVRSQYDLASSRARSWFSSNERKDRALARRVRIDLWRAAADTQNLGIIAHNGEVILHGRVRAEEHPRVLEIVSSVAGVRNIADHLTEGQAIAKPAAPAKLQRAYVTARNNLMQEKWSPPTRLWTSTLGLGMMGWGARHRKAVGMVGVLTGAALVLRGSSNVPLGRLARKSGATVQ